MLRTIATAILLLSTEAAGTEVFRSGSSYSDKQTEGSVKINASSMVNVMDSPGYTPLTISRPTFTRRFYVQTQINVIVPSASPQHSWQGYSHRRGHYGWRFENVEQRTYSGYLNGMWVGQFPTSVPVHIVNRREK